MPRPRFSNRLVQDTFTLAASGSTNVDVDLLDSFYPQMLLTVTYQASATNGISGTIYPGFAVDNLQTVNYADNGNSVVEFSSTVPVFSLTSQVKRTAFAVNPEVYPRYLRLTLKNNDSSDYTIRIVGDW